MTSLDFIYKIGGKEQKMSAATKKVGITGAAGNIGTTLQRGLSEKYNLTLYDIKEIKEPKGKFVEVDLTQKKQIK